MGTSSQLSVRLHPGFLRHHISCHLKRGQHRSQLDLLACAVKQPVLKVCHLGQQVNLYLVGDFEAVHVRVDFGQDVEQREAFERLQMQDVLVRGGERFVQHPVHNIGDV